jgi:hypothetical protein
MTVPVFTQEEYLSYLKDNGCNVANTDNWNELDTILLEKDGETFTIFLEKSYFYYTVVIKCQSLNIKPPEDHFHSFCQSFKPDEPCYCKNGKRFKECHGVDCYK